VDIKLKCNPTVIYCSVIMMLKVKLHHDVQLTNHLHQYVKVSRFLIAIFTSRLRRPSDILVSSTHYLLSVNQSVLDQSSAC